ncbi:hypothetical protein E2C01_009005 [Portunus trituberculatus]|uniref:Uncharacterized protein n=1 Tax=Portunus trituberculatus TaxID=210409 RepID=A0A5B7D4B5_PORTR|nr:hypothetical protein [Portunus trituberculatus]
MAIPKGNKSPAAVHFPSTFLTPHFTPYGSFSIRPSIASPSPRSPRHPSARLALYRRNSITRPGSDRNPNVKRAVNPESDGLRETFFLPCYEWKRGRKCTRDVGILIWPGEVWKIGRASEEPERRAVCSPEGSVCVSGDEAALAEGEAGLGGRLGREGGKEGGRVAATSSRMLRLRKRGETVPPPQDEVESLGRKLGRTFYCDPAPDECVGVSEVWAAVVVVVAACCKGRQRRSLM